MQTKKKVVKADIVRFYKKCYNNKIEEKVVREVLNLINTMIREKTYEGTIVRLPRTLGELYVKRSKSKINFNEDGTVDYLKTTIPTDWGSTLKLWKEEPETKNKVYLLHENINTDGYRMKIVWRTNSHKHDHVRYMQFTPARIFKRGLAQHIKTNNKIDYFDK